MDISIQDRAKMSRYVREFLDLLRRTVRTQELADACVEAFDWSPGVEEGDPAGMVEIVVEFVRNNPHHPSRRLTPPPTRAYARTRRLEEVVVRWFRARNGMDILLGAIWQEEDEGHADGAEIMIRYLWAMRTEDVLRMFRQVNRRGDNHPHVDAVLRQALASLHELRGRTTRSPARRGRLQV